MSYPDKSRKKLRGIFPANSREANKKAETQDSPSVFLAENQYYAIASEHQTVERFKVILRSGKVHSIPYALLPIGTLDGGTLYIKAYELLIKMSGRNLDPIEEHFSSRSLLWVKASPSGKDDGISTTFVQEIVATGKAIPESENP